MLILAQDMDLGLTSEDWMRAGLVLVVALIVARIVQRVIVRAGEKRGAEPHGLGVVARFLSYLVFIVGFFYALNAVGVELGPLIGLLGIFGLAVALAVQDIFANFIAGIILLIRRPFRPGDEVQVGTYEGLVEDINLRVTQVRQVDGVAVLVPNNAVLSNAIVNFTQRPLRRTTLAVGVAYATDLPVAVQTMRAAMEGVEAVSGDPAPSVFVHEFGDSSINLVANFWHSSKFADEWQIRHDVALAIKAAFDDTGIEIPFPQRVITTAD